MRKRRGGSHRRERKSRVVGNTEIVCWNKARPQGTYHKVRRFLSKCKARLDKAFKIIRVSFLSPHTQTVQDIPSRCSGRIHSSILF